MIDVRTDSKGRKRYRVRIFLGVDQGGPKKIEVGTYDHLRGEGGAQEAERKAKDELSSGEYAGPCRLSVKQLLERYLRDYASAHCRDSTVHLQRIMATHYVYPELGDLRASRLASTRIAEWQAKLLRCGRKNGKPCAPKTARNARGLLHGAYAWAVSIGLLSRNPVSAVDPPAAAGKDLQPPDIETIQRYIDELRDTRYWMPVLLGAATGMRRGEILGLRFCDVDMASGRVTITRQLVQIGTTVSEHPPKTKSGKRELTLPEFALEALIQHRRSVAAKVLLAGRSWDETAPICGDIKPDALTGDLRALLDRRRLPRVHMHSLRHALATEMLRNGENAQVVQLQLGHAQVSTTLGVYGHLSAEDVAAAATRYHEAWKKVDSERSKRNEAHSGPTEAKVVGIGVARSHKVPAQRRGNRKAPKNQQ